MTPTGTSAGSPRPARADARRNYERVLAAARDVFTEHGVDASLNDVARRADVGAATLYRHFPTREALLEALLADRYNQLAGLAHDLRSHTAAGDALVVWLRAFIAHITTFRGLAAPVKTAMEDETSALFSACHTMQTAWQELVTDAQGAGIVRSDMRATDLLRLANAIAWGTEELPDSTSQAARLLGLALEGAMTPGRGKPDR